MSANRPHRARGVTIHDVAREAGVSYSTVSRVLNGSPAISAGTRNRVLEASTRLGYVVNLQARSLAGGRSSIVGVFMPNLDAGYMVEIAQGVDVELASSDYDLLLFTVPPSPGKEARLVTMFSNGLVGGFIIVTPELIEKNLPIVRALGVPLVLIDPPTNTASTSYVDVTNWQGAYDGTRYLADLGHRRIAMITGRDELRSAADRLEGYRAALEDFHIPFDEQYIAPGDFTEAGSYTGTRRLLEARPRPTAIFASSDRMAFGAYDALREAGLSIPGDVSVLGFDGISTAAIAHPKLTTVAQPLAQIGRMAARILIELIEKPDMPPRCITLKTQLVIRESCAPPQQA